VIAVMNLLAVPFESICIPYLFKSVVGVDNQAFGLIQAAMVAGMLIGNTALISVLARTDKSRLFSGSLLAQHLLTLLFTLMSLPAVSLLYQAFSLPFLMIAVALLVVIGIGNGITNTMLMAALQTQIPLVMMGRFVGIVQLVCGILSPLGVLLVGALLDMVPIFPVMAGLAVLLLIVVLWFVGKPHVGVFARQYEVSGDEPA
jgi:MFS family permease